MKKTLLIAALSMAAAPAFASKARLSALGDAEHLSDIQRTFDRPYEATMHGEYATIEFGSAMGTPNAEAGFTRQVSEGNYLGFYVNRKPQAMVDALTSAGFNQVVSPLLDNSFNVFYGSRAGEMAWGVNFFYLSSDKKNGYTITTPAATLTSGKADVMGLSLGAAAGNWEADAVVGLSGKATIENGATVIGPIGAGADAEFKSTSNITLRGAYKMENMYYFARYGMGGGKGEIAGNTAADIENTDIELGLINSMKSEGAEFFYGVSYMMETKKNKAGAGTKEETNTLPLIVGVEADANSWMVLRGSVRHNLPFLSTTKPNGGESATQGGGTTIGAGAGFKLNKFTVDALFQTASSGTFGFDGANFVSNASLTYAF